MLKVLTALSLLALPTAAHATISCAGETNGSPTVVRVDIHTAGNTNSVAAGRVTITPEKGPARTYDLVPQDIPQFFESADGADQKSATVGLSAFVAGDAPVYIRFVGPNTFNDLVKDLKNTDRQKRDEAMKKEGKNTLRVWKGPGYASDQQHTFKDVVCSVWTDQ